MGKHSDEEADRTQQEDDCQYRCDSILLSEHGQGGRMAEKERAKQFRFPPSAPFSLKRTAERAHARKDAPLLIESHSVFLALDHVSLLLLPFPRALHPASTRFYGQLSHSFCASSGEYSSVSCCSALCRFACLR